MANPQAFTELPMIDVGALGDGTAEQRRVVAAELGRAAAAAGFCYVSGTGIASSVFDGLLAAAKAFFALPMEEKMRSYIGLSRCHRGYVPEGEEVFYGGTIDHKEAFDTGPDLPDDDPDYLAGNPVVGPNQWPTAIPGFAAAVSAYYRDAMALGRRLLGALAVAMGEPEDTFSRHMTKPPSQLRLIHYPHDPDAADAPGIGAHTDYELITLLRPTSPGLEVLNGAGEWIDVPPRGDALVVNIGDMLELWSNGRYVATSHRVRKVTEERYSFPLFCTLDYDTVLGPLPRLLAPGEEPPSSLVVGEHLFAQTAQTFTYLKKRVAAGELALPAGSLTLSSFGQEARQRPALRPAGSKGAQAAARPATCSWRSRVKIPASGEASPARVAIQWRTLIGVSGSGNITMRCASASSSDGAPPHGCLRAGPARISKPPQPLADALTCCDMTTSPDGKPMNVGRRLAEIRHRYGSGHLVSRSIRRATPMILQAVGEVHGRAASTS